MKKKENGKPGSNLELEPWLPYHYITTPTSQNSEKNKYID